MPFVLFYFIQLLLFVLIFVFSDFCNPENIAICFVLFNVIITWYFFYCKMRKILCGYLLNIVLLAFIIRILVLFLDVYHVIPIIHSGSDSEGFHEVAFNNAVLEGFNGTWRTYTNYSNLLSCIYLFCNAQRLVGQYLNVLLGMGVVYYILLSCRELNIGYRITRIVVAICSFFPTSIIFSGILLREAWQEFFIIYSLFYFIKWFKTGCVSCALIAISAVLFAAFMHSGCLFIMVGYLLSYIFYNPLLKRNSINISKLFVFSVLFVILFIFLFNTSMFTQKFAGIKDMEKDVFYERLKVKTDAGSKYLTWIDIDNGKQLIAFSPLKMFYFLFSPIPFDWRGVNDIIAFLLDAMLYICMVYNILKYKKFVRGVLHKLLYYIMISIFVTVFVFGYGTGTSGSAMRHRIKIMPLLIMEYAIIKNEQTEKKKNYYVEN